MRCLARLMTGCALLAGMAVPALAQQPYGYAAPPPPAYAGPPPGYGPPPGSRCEASFEGGYSRHRFICPMRVGKPVGAPCRCVPLPPAPGYPPGPPASGHVIP